MEIWDQEEEEDKMKKDLVKVALIPSLEPDENLIEIVNKLLKSDYEVVVVDDGSGSDYKKIFDKCKCKVISYDVNRGKGYALKTGLKFIKENYNNALVVTMDSDGQHTVEDAEKIIKYAKKHENTLVLGSRKRGENTPLRSFFGNTITCFIFDLVTHTKIYDTQTGLRAFSSKLIDYLLEVEGDRFEYEMNVLLNLSRNNIKVHEITIQTIYINKNGGSHFNAFKDSYKIYKEIFKYSLSSIMSFIIDYILFILFNLLTSNVILSNIFARIISGTTNYCVNRSLVFKSTKSVKSTFYKYVVLAVTILLFNTFLVMCFSKIMNVYLAKIITEIILFFASWLVQKLFIFRGDDYNKKF